MEQECNIGSEAAPTVSTRERKDAFEKIMGKKDYFKKQVLVKLWRGFSKERS
jgi:hypothetical protein